MLSRQYGRGKTGGQVRDDRRNKQDPARAGRYTDNNNSSGNNDQQQNAPDTSYYAGDKRERDEDNADDAEMGDRPEKNPRFRED